MPPHPAREKTRRHVEHYHKHEEGQRRTPGILLQVGVRLDAVLVDHERQRCHGAPTDVENTWLPMAVNSSGAASPTAREMASSDAVTSPGMAVGITMLRATRARRTPSARPASQRSLGTVRRAPSPARITIGSMSTPRATLAEKAEK